MADENILDAAPTRFDDQILPFAAWNTLTYEAKTGAYSFQLDETRFVLDANLVRDALEIMPIDQAYQFVSPSSGDAIMDFVNQLGYTEIIHFVSRMAVNNLYQPWRATLSMINQCLTGKTSGHDKSIYPVLQIIWGIITSTNVDNAELLWEEFVKAIQTFLTDKANLGSPTKKGRKDKPHVIPYFRFTKIIICHLGRIHNIHQRSASPFHLAEEDFRLGNLKFVTKGEIDEVFGMPIPDELISNNIRKAPYYNAYLEMVAKHDRKVKAKNEGKKKIARSKQPRSKPAVKKLSKLAPEPKPKATKERPSKASTAKPPKPKPAKEKSTKTTLPEQARKGKIVKVCKAKSPFQLVNEPDEEPAHSEPKPELKHQVTEEASTGPSAQAQDDTSINIVRDLPSHADAEIETCVASEKTNSGGDTGILQFDEEQRKDVDDQVNLEEKTNELDQGQTGSDPSRNLESRPPPEQVVIDEGQAGSDPGKIHGALAGPDPEPTYDEFMADLYPKFINDKLIKDESGKLNVESEVVSMVTVPIHQASSLIPPLSTPIIDLSPPKPASFTKEPIFTATTTTTITLLPPPQPQSTTESEDLPHKINEVVCEPVREAVYVALQALLRDRFRELPEADMKEILHQRMDEFLAEKDKARKRRRDDQDPPPTPSDSDLNKRRQHDTGTSGSSQPQAP
nr:monodehydroascorbate reductase [Tanacetum cinerariifolium]